MNQKLNPEIYEDAMYRLVLANPDDESLNIGGFHRQCYGCCTAIELASRENCINRDDRFAYLRHFNDLFEDETNEQLFWWVHEDWQSRIIALQLCIEVLKDEIEMSTN